VLPSDLGGHYDGEDHVTFEFDTSHGGLLHCPDHIKPKKETEN
jgi:hypothetical protein